jgi:hypothetical protein
MYCFHNYIIYTKLYFVNMGRTALTTTEFLKKRLIMNTNRIGAAGNPTLRDVLNLLKEEIFLQLNCHQVGEIVSFNPSLQTAEIQVKMKRPLNGELKDYPLLIDCPVVVLSGGAGRLTLPISAGDGCLVLFNDKDIDNWWAYGVSKEPNSVRKHAFTDAMAIVGLYNKSNAISDYLPDGTQLKYGGSVITLKDGLAVITSGAVTITMDGSSVTVESPVTNFTGAANFAGAITAPSATFSAGLTVQGKDIGLSHKHSGVQTGGGQTGGVV